MRLTTSKLILKKKLFGAYSAYYKEEGKLHIFADNISKIVYHGDFCTYIHGNILIVPMDQKELCIEYIEKSNTLIIDRIY